MGLGGPKGIYYKISGFYFSYVLIHLTNPKDSPLIKAMPVEATTLHRTSRVFLVASPNITMSPSQCLLLVTSGPPTKNKKVTQYIEPAL